MPATYAETAVGGSAAGVRLGRQWFRVAGDRDPDTFPTMYPMSPPDPLAPARSVTAPAISELLDRDSGTYIDARAWVDGHLYQTLIRDRVEIVERMNAGDPRFLCSDCSVPVYLVSRPEDRVFYFRHIREDGSCPARTRSALSAAEITARKYHGLRESKPHRDIKALIQRSLAADPHWHDIAAETTWRSQNDPDRYRRPDVQARFGVQRYAFEVQLSTTFLSVVAARRAFYRGEGALLVWIFGSFDPAYRRLTTDDLLFSNNSNIFIVDEETTALSEATGRFHLRCWHREPFIDVDRIADRWIEVLVRLDALKADLESQRLFAFDYGQVEKDLRLQLDAIESTAEDHLVWIDQQDFFEFWQVHGGGFHHTPENRKTWTQLCKRFAARGIELPQWPDNDEALRAMLHAFYSLRMNKPIGWNFAKLIQVAQNVAEYHPSLMTGFGFAVKHFDRTRQLAEQDQSGKWRERRDAASPLLAARDSCYRPPASTMPLMAFLFPEIAAKVRGYWALAPVEELRP